MGIKSFLCLFFHMRSGQFLDLCRVNRLYPLPIFTKTSMVGQTGDIQGLNIDAHPYFGNFFNILWPS